MVMAGHIAMTARNSPIGCPVRSSLARLDNTLARSARRIAGSPLVVVGMSRPTLEVRSFMKQDILIGVLLLSAGCARKGFSKPEAAEYDFGRDYLYCSTPEPTKPERLMDCKGPNCNQIQLDTNGRSARTERVSRDLVFACLRSKGWHLGRGGFRP